MMKLATLAAVVVLLSLSLFFTVIIAYLGISEILPAIRQGTLNVDTSTMILNRVWVGNEIYILLVLYLLMAAGLAWCALRMMRIARTK